VTSFGRFQILGELGRGGMGVVFRAHDPDMGRDLALKVLRSDPSLSPAEQAEMSRRFDREAKAAGGLNHPNIVVHYERGEIGAHRYIAMELVEGRALYAMMSEGPAPSLPEALSILRQMAAALDYAHSRGVIHRDIKPANVLASPGGGVKIADFGIAKCSLFPAATATSLVIGSPHYMAPEQIEGRGVTGRTDQWALAVTAYELLTGNKPFDSDSVASLFQQILASAPPDPRTLEPRLPPAAKQVLEKALSKLPENRFDSCTDFVEALSGAVSGAAPAAPGGGRRGVVVRVKPGWSWAAAAAAVLLLFAATAWLVVRQFGGLPAMARGEPAASSRAPQPGEVRVNPRDGLRYVWIAPGRFRMGCSEGDGDCQPDETPHQVELTKGYWLGQTEVTTGAYKGFCRVAGSPMPAPAEYNPGWANDALPIENVSWADAAAYCRWAEGRLPTEAEWEFAARAGSAEPRYGPVERIGWSKSDSGLQAREVARKQANALGLYDMIGNVWEWTADRYHEAYYLQGPRTDPRGPDSGHFRVLRGGSWIRDAVALRASHRYPLHPDSPDHAIGFRCAADELP
jgi:serine/threonine-protein kinase